MWLMFKYAMLVFFLTTIISEYDKDDGLLFPNWVKVGINEAQH